MLLGLSIGLYGQHAFGNVHLSEGLIAGLDFFFPRTADEMNSGELVQWRRPEFTHRCCIRFENILFPFV